VAPRLVLSPKADITTVGVSGLPKALNASENVPTGASPPLHFEPGEPRHYHLGLFIQVPGPKVERTEQPGLKFDKVALGCVAGAGGGHLGRGARLH
jgi:hypothetical protein